MFLNYVEDKHGQITKDYFLAGELVVTEVDDDLLSWFKTEE